MPLRNAHTGNVVASSNSRIWISDQLLSQVFARFAAAVCSSRGFKDVRCLGQGAQLMRNRQPINTSTPVGIRRKTTRNPIVPRDTRRSDGAKASISPKHSLTDLADYKPKQSRLHHPLPALRLHKPSHNHNGPRQHEQLRHAHNVPGPLEARRRGNRRRFNLATGGVQAGGSFFMDYEVMLNSMWGRPKQPYWEWQAPAQKTSPQADEGRLKSRSTDSEVAQIDKGDSSVPDWLTNGFDIPYERSATAPASVRVNDETLKDTGHVLGSSITTTEEFRRRIAILLDPKAVTQHYDSLNPTLQQNPAFHTAALERMAHCYLHYSMLHDSSSGVESHIVDFAYTSGSWSVLIERLSDIAATSQDDEAYVSQNLKILSLLDTALGHASRTNLEVLPLLKCLDIIVQLTDSHHAEVLEACEDFVDRALSGMSSAELKQAMNAAQHMQSGLVAISIARKVVRPITNAETNIVSDVTLGLIWQPLAVVLDHSILATASQRVVGLAHNIYSDILSWPNLTTTSHNSAVSRIMLQLAVNLPAAHPTSKVIAHCAESVLKGFDMLEDQSKEQNTLDLLNRYAQKLLLHESAAAEATEGTFLSTQPLVARLMDAASANAAHTWYLHTSFVLIDSYSETGDAANVRLLNLWGRWAACSMQIRDKQRELDDAHVQNFYFKLLSVFKPSEVPHTLHILPPHQLGQVLLRHYLVRVDVQSRTPSSKMFGFATYSDLRNHFMRALGTVAGGIFSAQARILEAVSETFEVQVRKLCHQREREVQKAREDTPSTWISLEYDVFTTARKFGAVLYDERLVPLSKPDTYNKEQKILKTNPAGILPYLSLLTAMKEHDVPSKVISHLLHEILQILSAIDHHGWISHLALATQSHLNLTFTPDLLTFLAHHINTTAQTYPSESLGLFNKLRQIRFTAVPSLIPALIASNRSKLHPKQIMPLFFYYERDTLPNAASALYDRDSATRPISPFLTDQTHNAALAFARASRFSTQAAWDCVHALYAHLTQHNAAIDDRMSRALVIAGVLRPIRDGTCYKIPEAKFRFVLSVVTQLEGHEIADRIDEMARNAEKEEGAAAGERRRMLRRRMPRPRAFDGRPGEELAPRIGDFDHGAADSADAEAFNGDGGVLQDRASIKPGWKQRQRARERRAGGEDGLLWNRRKETGTWSGFRYL